MADTIESFVAKLQAEGVDAGKAQAEKLRTEADAQAQRIVADAQAQAAKIIATAQADADNLLARGKTELQLAARDTSLKLHEALNRGMLAIVAQSVKEPMSDPAFLGKLLHEIILLYVKELQANKDVMRINVPEDLRSALSNWALHEIGQAALDGMHGVMDMKSTLAGAGLEYTVSGATVEITPESVTQSLSEILSPALRDALNQAMDSTPDA